MKPPSEQRAIRSVDQHQNRLQSTSQKHRSLRRIDYLTSDKNTATLVSPQQQKSIRTSGNAKMSRNESNSKSGGLVLSVKIEGTSKRIGGKRDNEAIQQQQPMNISRNINNASLDKSIMIETDTSESGKRPLQVTLDECVSEDTLMTLSPTIPPLSSPPSLQNRSPRRGAASSEVGFRPWSIAKGHLLVQCSANFFLPFTNVRSAVLFRDNFLGRQRCGNGLSQRKFQYF